MSIVASVMLDAPEKHGRDAISSGPATPLPFHHDAARGFPELPVQLSQRHSAQGLAA